MDTTKLRQAHNSIQAMFGDDAAGVQALQKRLGEGKEEESKARPLGKQRNLMPNQALATDFPSLLAAATRSPLNTAGPRPAAADPQTDVAVGPPLSTEAIWAPAVRSC